MLDTPALQAMWLAAFANLITSNGAGVLQNLTFLSLGNAAGWVSLAPFPSVSPSPLPAARRLQGGTSLYLLNGLFYLYNGTGAAGNITAMVLTSFENPATANGFFVSFEVALKQAVFAASSVNIVGGGGALIPNMSLCAGCLDTWTPPHTNDGSPTSLDYGLLVGVPLGIGLPLCFAIILYAYCRRSKQRAKRTQAGATESEKPAAARPPSRQFSPPPNARQAKVDWGLDLPHENPIDSDDDANPRKRVTGQRMMEDMVEAPPPRTERRGGKTQKQAPPPKEEEVEPPRKTPARRNLAPVVDEEEGGGRRGLPGSVARGEGGGTRRKGRRADDDDL